ncbi:MAG: hypothetical protein ACPGVH_10195, partial [Chitinophagales bacterium]
MGNKLNSKMDFKFYHGTSNIFLDSIKENGLGGLNPSIDFNLIEVLKYLRSKAETYLLKDKDYIQMQVV